MTKTPQDKQNNSLDSSIADLGKFQSIPPSCKTPQEIRDRWIEFWNYGIRRPNEEEIADFWLDVVLAHDRELVEKIKALKKEELSVKDIEDRLRVFTLTPHSDESMKEYTKSVADISSKIGINKVCDEILSLLHSQ